MAQDGARGTILYDANDRFCLDGQRLVPVPAGDYWEEGREYRTEIESFSKVVSYGTAGTGPAWFRVWTKAGQVLEYGATADSRIEAQGKSTVRVWAVNKISDTKGNFITFAYTEDEPNGQYVLNRIDYTGNTAGLNPGASVRFTYEARTDTSIAYRGGSFVKSTQRLANVKTYHGETLVTDYRLAYGYGAATGRSRLLSVTECAGATGADCLPSTSFTWPAENAGFTLNAGYELPDVIGTYSSQPVNIKGKFVDVNGDGLLDWVRAYRSGSGTNYQTTWLNTGSGWQIDSGYAPPDTLNAYSINPPNTRGQIIDVNGDGLPDWVRAFRSDDGINYQTTWINTGSGWQANGGYALPDVIWSYGFNPPNLRGQFVDVNGDGLPDWVRAYRAPDTTEYMTTWLNTGSGWSVNAGYALPDVINVYSSNPSVTKGQIVDVNGDGLPDFVRAYRGANGTNYQTTWINTGSGWSIDAAYALPDIINQYDTADPVTRGEFVDVNGDGLPDWVRAYRSESGNNYQTTWLNTGAGWVIDTAYALPTWINSYSSGHIVSGQFQDVNGDGLPDYVRAYRSSSSTVVKTTWLNTGSGWLNASAYVLPDLINLYDYDIDPTTPGEFADVNGDGVPDWVRAYRHPNTNEYKETRLADSVAPDLLSTLTDGLGKQVQLNYRPLTDKTIYVRDGQGTAGTYPVVNVQPPLYVATEVSATDGVGGSVSTTRSYGGLKAEVGAGRGILGFRWTETTDASTGGKVRSEHRQDWPYVGMSSLVRRTQASGATLSEATNTHGCIDPDTGGACTVAPGERYFPFVSSSVESGNDLNGATLPTVTTTSQFDVYGNATSVVVGTGDGYSKTTTNDYHAPDLGAWILGRLKSSTVQSMAP